MVGRGSTNQGDFTPLGRAFLQAAPPLFIGLGRACVCRGMGVFVRFFRGSRVDFYVFVCHGMVFVRRYGSRAGCRGYVCGVGVISKCREAGRVSSSGGCCCCCCCCGSVATEVDATVLPLK